MDSKKFLPALCLLLAVAAPALAQVPSKVTLSRANTPTADGFTVAWSDLSNETAYHLEHTTSANFTNSTLITNISANATSHTLTGLTPGTTYYVRVRGAAAGGNGTWSDIQANQLLSIDPSQTRYLSVAGVPHGASHSVNFTVSDVFGSANSAGLAAGSTSSQATTVMLLGSDGSTAHTIFYNSSQNEWREGGTNKGSEIVGFGKGFMVKNNTGSADIFLLSGSVPPLDTNSVTVFPAGAPAGRLSLVTPSKTTPTSLRFLGLTYSDNTTTGIKRATAAKDADLLLIPDTAGGLRRYHFDGTNWRSGLRMVSDPNAVTIPAGGAFFLRKASGSSFEQWRPPSDIVTDGLVLLLDAGNPASYPGNGTTWTDLSGTGNNATLTNGPTYSSSNGGNIVLDGVNDYIEVATRNTSLEFQPTQPYSFFCWVYNLAPGVGAVISNMMASSNYPGWDLMRNSSTTLAAHIISSWSANAIKVQVDFDFTANANKWVYLGYVYDGTSPANSANALNSINFYVNGQLLTTNKTIAGGGDGFNSTSQTTTYNSSQRLRLGSRWASGAWVNGGPLTISHATVYNRTLSQEEIQRNFNALKGRYGL